MSKKRESTKSLMWQIWPDRPGWHVLDAPRTQQMFVLVQATTEANGAQCLAARIPGVALGMPWDASLVVNLSMAQKHLGDEHFGWYWQPITIPDECPEFDMEDE